MPADLSAYPTPDRRDEVRSGLLRAGAWGKEVGAVLAPAFALGEAYDQLATAIGRGEPIKSEEFDRKLRLAAAAINFNLIEELTWLDYSLSVVLWRLISRTVRRIVGREDLGSGQREGVGRLFTQKSIIWWAITSHRPLRAEYERATAIYSPAAAVIRLRSPRAAGRWIETVSRAV